jgi:cytochrome oxidase assembly protein ShyY1
VDTAAIAAGEGLAAPSNGFPELPSNHLNYAIIWISLWLIDVIMLALQARKALKS